MTMDYGEEEAIRFALSDWHSDSGRFGRSICGLSRVIANSVGYLICFDEPAIDIVHQNWVAHKAVWQKERVVGGQGLSEMKQLSLLLFQLASVEWVSEIRDTHALPAGYFKDNRDIWENIRNGIRGAPECYLGLQFVTKFINQIEGARRDRVEDFIFRLTPDLQHDIIVYLQSEARDPLALFLILKALYARLGGHPN